MQKGFYSEELSVGVVSQNPNLPSILGSALGKEFSVAAVVIDDSGMPVLAKKTDALMLDIARPNPNGISCDTILNHLLSKGIPVIIMTDDDHRQQALDLVEAGAHSFIRTPPAIRELKAALRAAFERSALASELRSARQELGVVRGLDEIVGSGAQMQIVYRLIHKVANLENSVLVTGESGTGKELIARAIHNTGNRASRPFVAVSCGAIPESLIEAELFGHEKGAFTGSVGQREGYFEKAGDGTLFLDEIGELSPQIQVKLLRVLQQREFNRLGSSRNIPLRARVVLATHRDLTQMVAAGEFRQDLYYRINVMTIKVPALRRHPEDVALLVPHFIRKYAETYRKPVETIEPDALAMMQEYSWPGNVRELENAVQSAIIMAEGYSIKAVDLPEAIFNIDAPALDDEQMPSGSFERLLRDYKVKLAMDAIQQCGGNKTLAAQSLSISRAYLHRLIRLTEPAPVECQMAELNPPRRRLSVAAS